MPPLHPVVAIDGTAASGKSTFARELAARLGFVYVNTGAIYRGVTWFVLERAIALEDEAAVAAAILGESIATTLEQGELHFRIGALDPLPYGREARVNAAVSQVARVSAVRRLLVAQQQALAAVAPLVMEGRDIGTVVFPATPFKIYLDAAPEVRASRRLAQGEADSIARRDGIDSQRADSPLVRAPDALPLDSGTATVPELVAHALTYLRTRGLELPGG